ncbi:MAG: hypothetical protein QOH46_1012 [Solirubrobacteraceae bacterium]|jgi:hypothetical protein|nr:hypothetical protein [Solirubrobacteraceae bacterium]
MKRRLQLRVRRRCKASNPGALSRNAGVADAGKIPAPASRGWAVCRVVAGLGYEPNVKLANAASAPVASIVTLRTWLVEPFETPVLPACTET